MSTTDLEAEVTALRATVEELRRASSAQQLLLRAIADHAPVVLYAKDLAGRFLLSNRRHAELLGTRSSEVVGRSEADLVGPEAAAEIQAVVDEVVRSGQASAAELVIPVGGEPRVFFEQMFPLLDAEGRCDGIGGAALDITERKLAEDSVRIFAALAEHSPDGVLVQAGEDGSRVWINPALLRLLGLPPGTTPQEATRSIAALAVGEVERSRGTGEAVNLAITRFQIPDPRGGPSATATVLRDVTAMRRAVREREEQASIVRRQQEELITELSAPLLPLARGVLLLPLIGSLDEARSHHVREAVLDAIVANQARVLIVDLTGLRAAEAASAGRLLHLVGAVRLIGARVVLTGIRPEVAATLVESGFTPRPGLMVLGTLQDAVRATLAAVRG